MACYVGISQDIDQGQHRRDVHTVDQELFPKLHSLINAISASSYNVI